MSLSISSREAALPRNRGLGRGGPRLSEPQRVRHRVALAWETKVFAMSTRCGSESRGPPDLASALGRTAGRTWSCPARLVAPGFFLLSSGRDLAFSHGGFFNAIMKIVLAYSGGLDTSV